MHQWKLVFFGDFFEKKRWTEYIKLKTPLDCYFSQREGTSAMAFVMTSGMGSVVSPIPRLIISASGYFSKWAALLLAIWMIVNKSILSETKSQNSINKKSKQMRVTFNLRKQISCLEFGHVGIARDTSLVSFRTGGRKYQETTSVFMFPQHLQATPYMTATPTKQGDTTANRKQE